MDYLFNKTYYLVTYSDWVMEVILTMKDIETRAEWLHATHYRFNKLRSKEYECTQVLNSKWQTLTHYDIFDNKQDALDCSRRRKSERIANQRETYIKQIKKYIIEYKLSLSDLF